MSESIEGLKIELLEKTINECNSSSFLSVLEMELARLESFVSTELQKIYTTCQELLACTHETKASEGETFQDSARSCADNAHEHLLNLIYLLRDASKCITEIVKNADSQLGIKWMPHLKERLSVFPWSPSSHLVLIVLFSDVYEAIWLKESLQVKSGVWKAPSTFERVTSKYWIDESNLNELFAVCAKVSPLLVFGKEWPLTTELTSSLGEDNLWPDISSIISSVYFDTKSMELYKDRIARKEGAMLFRIRWYGKKPCGNEHVFLELKTHHEKWVNCKSIKQRVKIYEDDVMTFLEKKPWTLNDAILMVKRASPLVSKDELSKSAELLLRMHKLVVDRKLHPCVRSVYDRVAFQSPKSNAVRLTIDRNITLIDERSISHNDWCLEDVTKAPTKKVPYSVFEVKLAGDTMPASIKNLIDHEIVVESPKFSKYLSGAAAYNKRNVQTLPYWAECPEFANFFDMADTGATKFLPACKQIKTNRTSESDDTELMSSCTGKQEKAYKVNWFGKKSPSIAPRRATRVEPKSYFANERTFIQWISSGMLLLTFAFLMTEILARVTLPVVILLLTGAAIVCYSVAVYYRRLYLLQSGSPEGYVDHVGPLLLAVALLTGIIVVYIHFDPSFGQPSSLTVSTKCYKHSLEVSKLEFQPSDVYADRRRDLLYIVSRSRIMVVSPNNSSRVVANINGTDFEGITSTPDGRIFAISEDPSKNSDSLLYELVWDKMNENLLVANNWLLSSGAAEGIAYIPDTNGGPGYLYIASNLIREVQAVPVSLVQNIPVADDTGRILVYKIPDANSSALNIQHIDMLNSKVIGNGLLDSKISSLQYLDGILYTLHDNSHVTRSWNLSTGDLVNELNLPSIGFNGLFDKQWEGFFLERRYVASGYYVGLRGGYPQDKETLLHLTLDSPGQVWTLVVEERNGVIQLPSCASR